MSGTWESPFGDVRPPDGAEVIDVPTASRSYQVLCGRGLIDRVGPLARPFLPGEKVLIVSDANVWNLYGDRVADSLRSTGLEICIFVFPAGEAQKNLRTFGTCLEVMADAGLTRDDGVVALGGGVTGDLGAFAAATYMRGTRVIQVPTSLLAMVDSSVGGKTAVDLAGGKNLAGAFFQPSLVVVDVDVLASLTPSLLIDSFGEVIKHGVLSGPDLFYAIANDPVTASLGPDGCEGLDFDRMVSLVAANIRVKRDVVVADERESGLRQTLNLGHTIGHAIEAASGYGFGHGSCVAAGLAILCRGATALGLTPAPVTRAIQTCIVDYGLPTATDVPVEAILERARSDKKRHGDTVNAVIVRYLGSVDVVPMPFGEFSELVRLGMAL